MPSDMNSNMPSDMNSNMPSDQYSGTPTGSVTEAPTGSVTNTPSDQVSETETIYSAWYDNDGSPIFGGLYAIKGESGEMIPVHYDSFNNEYVVMTPDEVDDLPNLPDYPVPSNVKI